MPEDLIIKHCSPTLAGLKSGSMFSVTFDRNADMVKALKEINGVLKQKGLSAIPFKKSETRYLIYIYRPAHLIEELKSPHAIAILKSLGYEVGNLPKCLSELARRIKGDKEFPHEIGLFLGYPPEDVLGFMEYKCENGACSGEPKCTGCWRVFGDKEAAERKFNQYKKCTRVYAEVFQKGRPLDKLIVPSKEYSGVQV